MKKRLADWLWEKVRTEGNLPEDQLDAVQAWIYHEPVHAALWFAKGFVEGLQESLEELSEAGG